MIITTIFIKNKIYLLEFFLNHSLERLEYEKCFNPKKILTPLKTPKTFGI